MKKSAKPSTLRNRGVRKCRTGIEGLDQITGGGLPVGRPTLVCGGAGCGKTLLAMEFVVRGATQFNEPGVFMSFEENSRELADNVASLGYDLDALVAQNKLALDWVRVERSEIEETGEYDLEGLFVRLNYAIDSVKAKRVVLDTIEALFSGLSNTAILRAELRRLFRWLKEKGVTAIVTGERGDATLTRQGLEEYVSDCVIFLDHRITQQISTRRLRVVKYRGSTHGTNEYPFLIDDLGINVLPVTSLKLEHAASTDRIPTGIDRLDTMLGGQGYFRGSSVLISGTAGMGKTSIAAHFANSACRRGEHCLYFAFEESPAQIIRNMSSIGIDLGTHLKRGLLEFVAARPSLYGLETHLANMHTSVMRSKPAVVVVDPVTNLISSGTESEVKAMLLRLVDYLKSQQITSLFTALTTGDMRIESTDVGISSLMDTWLLLRDMEMSGERNRCLHVLKSRGMAHSNQVREFLLTANGIQLADVYLGATGVLAGSARVAQEAKDRAEVQTWHSEIERKKRELEAKRKARDSQIASIQAQFLTEEENLRALLEQEEQRELKAIADRELMAVSRKADQIPAGKRRK